MSAKLDQFEELLKRIRDDFLEELPNRCQNIEQALIELHDHSDNDETFNEVFREAHSLKGSGGTHGLSLISVICHELENRLSQAHEGNHFDERFLSASLAFCDLIRQATELYTSNANDFSKVEHTLEKLKKECQTTKKSVLLVESSKAMKQLYMKTLLKMNIDIRTLDDGLIALHRLLHERYDLIILSGEIKSLNAKALIAAIKEGVNVNTNTSIILISSNEDVQFPYLDRIRFIKKDQHISSHLEKICFETLASN